MASIYSLSARTATGGVLQLSSLRGKAALVVNTASMCGFTAANMPDLAALHAMYAADGGAGILPLRRGRLAILAFPCDQFARQEPKSACEVADWAAANFGAEFTVMDKVNVKGPAVDPVFAQLGAALGQPAWNFTKYLVDVEGRPVRRYGPVVMPTSIAPDIDAELR